MGFDILNEYGSFGLERTWSNSEIQIQFGDGYYASYNYGLPQGLLTWKMVFNYLPQGGALIPTSDGRHLNRLNYILDFYQRNKIQGTKPFILTDWADGSQYLAIFSGPALSLTMIGQKFWRCSSLDLQQVRLSGYGDSGNPLTSPTPDSI